MRNDDLLKKLDYLGLPLFKTEEEFDVNAVLSEVVKNKDERLWEGFPVLLVNANKENKFNLQQVKKLFNEEVDKNNFLQLVLLSLAFYQYLHLKFWWANKLRQKLTLSQRNTYRNFLDLFRHKKDVKVGKYKLNFNRMQQTFNNYFKESEEKFDKFLTMHSELSLEYALSQVFTPKQKELFLKKVNGEKLTKTEREYFSRVVKKKASALANVELHNLARKLLA